MGFVIIVLAAWNQTKPPVRCDAIEINEILDDAGKVCLEQIVLWEWSPDYCRFDCIGFAICNTDKIKRTSRGIEWAGIHYVAPIVQHTVTRHDPEVESRKLFPKEKRPDIRGSYSWWWN